MVSFFPWIVMSHEKGIEHRPSQCFWVKQQQNSKKGILFWEKEDIKWLETAQPINLPCSFWKLAWLNHWDLICGLQACYFPILLILKLIICLVRTLFTKAHKQQFYKELKKLILNKYILYTLWSTLQLQKLTHIWFYFKFMLVLSLLDCKRWLSLLDID